MKEKDIRNLSYEELISYLDSVGQKSFRAAQIFDWIYKKGVEDFDSMKNLSTDLKEKLKSDFAFPKEELLRKDASRDGTAKFLFQLADQEKIETALIPMDDYATVCVSTQVGCKFACQFCASGLGGFKRNLTCSEIMGQILYAKRSSSDLPLTHVVFMGIGEPLDNYDQVMKAIRLINSPEALEIAARRITISTCGVLPGIRQLAEENLQIELAVSLHGSNDEVRNTLVPINKKYPLRELIQACKDYIKATNRQITFEYILIQNFTCSEKAAGELNALLKGMLCKLNLIAYNKIDEFDYDPPNKLEILAFQERLSRLGIHSTFRVPKGRDIHAACGQLRRVKA